jgi:uncharacterized protein (DUF305 family)
MTRQRTSTLIAAAVVVLAAGGTVLATRGGDPGSAAAPRAASSASPVRVIVPGRPGESAAVSDSDRVRAPDGSTYNTVDATFVRMMIVHHGQAVRMADLAADRAGSPAMRALAMRISAAQKPEIAVLRAWLQARRLDETDPGHDHATMPGMQSEAEVNALAAARGAAFDELFVAMMTEHHEGAIRMAGDVLVGGSDQSLNEMANEMAVEQGSEIRRMRQLGAG